MDTKLFLSPPTESLDTRLACHTPHPTIGYILFYPMLGGQARLPAVAMLPSHTRLDFTSRICNTWLTRKGCVVWTLSWKSRNNFITYDTKRGTQTVHMYIYIIFRPWLLPPDIRWQQPWPIKLLSDYCHWKTSGNCNHWMAIETESVATKPQTDYWQVFYFDSTSPLLGPI